MRHQIDENSRYQLFYQESIKLRHYPEITTIFLVLRYRQYTVRSFNLKVRLEQDTKKQQEY